MNRLVFLSLIATLCLVLAGTAFAHSYKLGALDIHHPWARPSAVANGAAYFIVKNTGSSADALIKVESDVAAHVEMHAMRMDGVIMRMRKLDRMEIPVGGDATFAPGGNHIMLIGLKRPLKQGDKFPMRLTFEKAGAVEVLVYVQTPEEMQKSEYISHNATKDSSMSDMPGMMQ